MPQARVSKRQAARAGERALTRLLQTWHHTDVAGERSGIPKSARIAQFCDQGGSISEQVYLTRSS
jgi:hypothetical protein